MSGPCLSAVTIVIRLCNMTTVIVLLPNSRVPPHLPDLAGDSLRNTHHNREECRVFFPHNRVKAVQREDSGVRVACVQAAARPTGHICFLSGTP